MWALVCADDPGHQIHFFVFPVDGNSRIRNLMFIKVFGCDLQGQAHVTGWVGRFGVDQVLGQLLELLRSEARRVGRERGSGLGGRPSRRRHTRWPRDWSSDVCSSDLCAPMTRATKFSFLFSLSMETRA